MDQDLYTVLAGETHSVEGRGDLIDGAVKGSVNGGAGGLDAAAGSQNALRKGLIGDLFLLEYLAAEGSQNGLALVHELDGIVLAGLVAEQLVKKAHNKILPSYHILA